MQTFINHSKVVLLLKIIIIVFMDGIYETLNNSYNRQTITMHYLCKHTQNLIMYH